MTASASDDRTPNRLAEETSPYLLQHAYNPVQWYPWGPEAFEAAKRENKPIFLSVGYSACHWCHVMERESFENPQIAKIMNDHFINVKVDREERPDVDQIYMSAVQAMTDHGGWPMSVFLTPDLKPFFGGTYFPPEDRRGMAGFPRVLHGVNQAWMDRKDEILSSASDLTERIKQMGTVPPGTGPLHEVLIEHASRALARIYDSIHGGFGSAPKFPHPMDLKLLLRRFGRSGESHPLQMARHTLEKLARGGIYDHLGGGFARYSTDHQWLVPHFEKMLYDNALLTSAYLEAFQITRDPEFSQVVRETFDYVLDRMTGSDGEIHATEDADSEGVEGKYYVWSLAEVIEVLGPERAKVFAAVYDVTEQGNWEHQNVLNLPKSITERAVELGLDDAALRRNLAEDRAKLLEAREKRVPPGKDTKVLTSWNGLMIGSLAEGSRVLQEPRYLEAARKAAGFILDRMRSDNGLLLHTYKDGRARFNGYLDDYSHFIDGLTRLFEVSGESRWLLSALELAQSMIDEFHDPVGGGFYYTGQNHEELIVRQKDYQDNALPSGNAMAATALARLGALTGRDDLNALARTTLEAVKLYLERAPMAMAQSLIALDFLLATPQEIVVVSGSDPEEFRAVLEGVYERFLPHKVVAPVPPGEVEPALLQVLPLLAERSARNGRTTSYVCENFTCQEPVLGVEGIKTALAPTPTRSS